MTYPSLEQQRGRIEAIAYNTQNDSLHYLFELDDAKT